MLRCLMCIIVNVTYAAAKRTYKRMHCKAKVHYGKRMVAAHARKGQVEISGEKKVHHAGRRRRSGLHAH